MNVLIAKKERIQTVGQVFLTLSTIASALKILVFIHQFELIVSNTN